MTVPEGNTLVGWEGAAGYIEGCYVGGGTQIYVEGVPVDWVRTIPAPWA
jgi:hypothetical protein